MKATKVLVVTGFAVTILTAIAAPVFAADDPATTIKTSVQNQTTNGALSDANTDDEAVLAKTGDILKYVIEIKNNADKSDDNDLSSGKLTDNLPAGIELVSNPNKRDVTDDFGTIKPGDTVTKQFLVKVDAGKDGETIENRGCFTGEYAKHNKPLSACDSAFIKIDLDGKKDEQPSTTTPEPTQTEQPQQTPTPTSTPSEDLPTTGPSDVVAPMAALSAGVLAYAARLLYLKRVRR
jgi:hypothetical protein